MSAQTHRDAPTTAAEITDDPKDLYLALVRESPEVCSRCHARVRAPRRAESNRQVRDDRLVHEHDTVDLDGDRRANLQHAESGVNGFGVEEKSRDGAIGEHHPKTFCAVCGYPPDQPPTSTSSERALRKRIPPLVDRFGEAGVPLNPDIIRAAIDKLRSSGYRGQETKIWRAATALAAQRARPRDCVRCTYDRD